MGLVISSYLPRPLDAVVESWWELSVGVLRGIIDSGGK